MICAQVLVAPASALCAIMATGFGTAGASLLPVYIQMGAPPVHLLAAAWMGAPASLTCAKLLCPDRPADRCVVAHACAHACAYACRGGAAIEARRRRRSVGPWPWHATDNLPRPPPC